MIVATGRLFQRSRKNFLFFLGFLCSFVYLYPQDSQELTKSTPFADYISSEFKISGLPGLAYGSCVKDTFCTSSGLGMYDLSTGEVFNSKSIVPLGNYSSILTRLAVIMMIELKKIKREDLLERKIKFLSEIETGITVSDLLIGNLGDQNDDLLFSLNGTSLEDWRKLDASFLKNCKQDSQISDPERNLLWEDVLLASLLEETVGGSYKDITKKFFSPPIHPEFFKFSRVSNNKISHYEYFFGFPSQHKKFPEKLLLNPSIHSWGNIENLMSLHSLLGVDSKSDRGFKNFIELGFKEYLEYGNKYYIFSGIGQGGNYSILIDLNNQTSYFILTNITTNKTLDNILKNYIDIMNGMEKREIIYSIDKLYSLLSILEMSLSIFFILFLGMRISDNKLFDSQISLQRNEAIVQVSLLFFLFLISYYFFIIFPELDYIKLQTKIYSFYGYLYKSDFKISTILLISVLSINSIYYYIRNY